MIIPFQIKIEYIIIAVLAILLFLKGSSNNGDCVTVAKETTVKEKTITTVDKVSIPVTDRSPEKVSFIETQGKIDLIKNTGSLSESARETLKQANRYLDTTRLKNALIYSDILSEGRILKFDMTAAIDHKETTITTKETLAKNVAGLFISPGFDYSPVYGVESVETSLMFIKGHFGASLGSYYRFNKPQDPYPGSFGAKIKIHIKL